MAKSIIQKQELFKKLAKGIGIADTSLRKTFGPKGSYALIGNASNSFFWTRDAKTIINSISLENPTEQIGVDLLSQAIDKTICQAGDGGKLTAILASSMFFEGLKLLQANVEPLFIKQGIYKALKEAQVYLNTMATPLLSKENIQTFATLISQNDPSAGELIQKAITQGGPNSLISVKIETTPSPSMTVQEGVYLDIGYLSPYFVTHPENMMCKYDTPSIFLSQSPIESAKEMAEILQVFYQNSSDPLIIIAEKLGKDALSTLTINKLKGKKPLAAIETSKSENNSKELFEDLSLLTNAPLYLSKQKDTIGFGRAKFAQIEKNQTVISIEKEQKNSALRQIEQTNKQIEKESALENRVALEKRLSRLSAEHIVIFVTGRSKHEQEEKKNRYQKAILATKKSISQGVVPGGGSALIRASESLSLDQFPPNDRPGVQILKKALLAPLFTLLEPLGISGEIAKSTILDSPLWTGLNILTNEYEDFSETTFDALFTVEKALCHSVSIATTLLSLDTAISLKT